MRVTTYSTSAISSVLRIARRAVYYVVRARPGSRYHRADDTTVLQQIRAVTNSRATYGYRRVWAMVNRTFPTARHIGAETDPLATYHFDRHLLGNASYNHFFPGDFIRQTGPARGNDFGYRAVQSTF